MKKLFNPRLMKAAISMHDLLGKFICKMLTLKNAENPPAATPDAANYFTCHRELADYLKCSVNTVKFYKRSGDIPSTIVDGHSWTSKSDVDLAIELHPAINALFKRQVRAHPHLMRIHTRCVKIDETWCFIYLAFQGWRTQIMAPASFMEDKELLQYVCDKAILFQHKIKPFRFAPTFNKSAA